MLTIAVVALWLCAAEFSSAAGGKWWKTRKRKTSSSCGHVKHGQSLILNERGIRSHWDEMRTNALPANTSLAEQQLLRSFDGWSQESGATVTGIMPQWKNDTTNYLTLNCRVEATGDLGTLSRFVYDIEKGPLGLKLDSVEFSTHDNFGQQLTLGLQVSGLALTTLK
jgi:Tfp pilus assembly protein PilO